MTLRKLKHIYAKGGTKSGHCVDGYCIKMSVRCGSDGPADLLLRKLHA